MTFAEDSVVRCKVDDIDKKITTTPKRVFDVQYKEKSSDSGGFISLDTFDLTNNVGGIYTGWKMLSKLNLMVSNNVSQQLTQGQSLKLTSSDIDGNGGNKEFTTPTVNEGETLKILSNSVLAFSGGEDISVSASSTNKEED